MKTCSTCHKEKVIKDFNWKNKTKKIVQSFCRNCQKEILKKHYLDNKKYYFNKNQKRRIEIKNFINQYKENKPCADCGIIYPVWVMDFDHLSNKKYNIARMSSGGVSIKKVLIEINKCEIVCSNCHRMRTYNRLRGGVTG